MFPAPPPDRITILLIIGKMAGLIWREELIKGRSGPSAAEETTIGRNLPAGVLTLPAIQRKNGEKEKSFYRFTVKYR